MRAFLDERLDTIFDQTFHDWELIVYDSRSDDGSWECFEEHALKEPRMRISQGPREGPYPGWNACISQARGEYVYIATSDDTMASDCLDKLVAALEENPSCDLAHCPLKTFDENGRELDAGWERSTFGRSAGALLDKPHLRHAPFDGLLHLLRGSVYISITQLLIRRSLFQRIGMFDPRWGSMGDFNWNMRASLVANTVHVPDTWGGWRRYSEQATAANDIRTAEYQAKIDDMINHAISNTARQLSIWIRRPLRTSWPVYFSNKERWCAGIQECSAWRRRLLHLWSLSTGNPCAWDYLFFRLGLSNSWRLDRIETVKVWTKRCGIAEPLRSLSTE